MKEIPLRDFVVDADNADSLFRFICELVKPYRSQHAQKFNCRWYQRDAYLTDSMVRGGIWGPDTYAFFQSSVVRVVGIDVDDHDGRGWRDPGSAACLLWIKYREELGRVLPAASLLCQSPRGLHAYWVMDRALPGALLFPLVRERIKHIAGVEVRPTMSEGLRLPSIRVLDPITGEPSEDCSIIAIYSAEQVLGLPAVDPGTLRKTLSERRADVRGFTAHLAIERIEKEWTPFVDGTSNEALTHLVPVYKHAGLTVEQAAQRIEARLRVSPLYTKTGDSLRNPRRLRQRIASFYRGDSLKLYRPAELSREHRVWVDALVATQPWAVQRAAPVRRFLEELCRWVAFHDAVMRDPGQRTLFDYLYPFYTKNRSEGFYPLPRTVLTRWNQRYFELMDWLRRIGALEAAPYPYAPRQGICRYYRVSWTLPGD